MKIAVTGASGHIGNNLCRKLKEHGHEIKILVHTFDKSLRDISAERIVGNILDKEIVNKLIKGSDCVFHTAALISIGDNPKEKIFGINIEGTRNVIESCIKYKVKRLIHFSSIHALFNSPERTILDENNPLAGTESFNYDQSKANAEKLVIEACGKGLNAVILNPSSVVGPNDFVPSLVGKLILQIARGKMPFLIKGGYHWVDVRDVVDAAINAIDKGRTGERYLLSSQFKSLKEISQLICKPEKQKPPLFIPSFIAWSGLPFIKLLSLITGKKALYTSESLTIVSHSPKQVNNLKAINELGFNPRNVEESFSDSLHWFKNNRYIK